jgi:hypothetical protein
MAALDLHAALSAIDAQNLDGRSEIGRYLVFDNS